MEGKHIHILIADDDDEDLELIEEAILEIEPGVKLHKVKNGKAAIEYLNGKAAGELPCLIILDYSMPEMNGPELLSILKKCPGYRAIPTVIFSTSGAAVHIQQCKERGATEYFVKPNTKTALSQVAEKMLALC